MKIKITTEDVIEATRFMTAAMEDKTGIIEGICQSHRITPDFVKEFRDIITPQMFMTSFRLSKEMSERFPDLFNDSEFRELMKRKVEDIVEESKYTNAINAVQAAINNYNQTSNSYNLKGQNQNPNLIAAQNQLNMLLQAQSEEELNVKHIVTNHLPNISISLLCDYYTDFINNEDYLLDEDLVKEIIRDSTTDEINNSDVLCLMGISAEIDELLLKRIKDEDLKNTILLTMSVSEDHLMTSTTYKHLSNDMKEDILGDEEVSVREFINALSDTQDLGWQIKMIDRAVKGEITLLKTGQVFDKEIVLLMSKLPEREILKLVSLSYAMPNTFSYKVVKWMLDNKDFSEDDLIEMKDTIKKAGLWFDLMKIAKENNYEKLKNAMKK